MKKLPLIFYMLLSFLFTINTISQTTTISSYDTPIWNTLDLSTVTPDGQWALIIKKKHSTSLTNKTYFLNTTTKKEKEITHLSNFYNSLYNNGLVVGNTQGETVIYSLNKNDSIVLKNSVKFSASIKKDLLFVHKKNNDFEILKLNERLEKIKSILVVQNIDKYFLSPDSQTLFVQNNNNELIHIDLKTLKSNIIHRSDSIIQKLQWNLQQNAILIHSESSVLTFIDLTTFKETSINLDENHNDLISDILPNNNIYISYSIKTDEKLKESEYLDIWQGNSKLLLPSNFKAKYKHIEKAFIYNTKQHKTIPLEKSRDIDYLNIGIPDVLISYNQYINQDFSGSIAKKQFNLYDYNKNKIITPLSLTSHKLFFPSLNNKYLLYPINNQLDRWEVLNLSTLDKHIVKTDLVSNGFNPIWANDSETIFYTQKGNLFTYNVKNKKVVQITDFKSENQQRLRVLNKENIPFYTTFLNLEKPLYFKFTDETNTIIYSLYNNKINSLFTTVKRLTLGNSLNSKLTSEDANTCLFLTEDYNSPPSIQAIKNKKVFTLLESEIDTALYSWRKRLDFIFTDKYNTNLNAYLHYPKDYNPNKKYPMVVYIYDLLLPVSPNSFSIPMPYTSHSGYNTSLLTENGYFVLQAQSYVSDDGPGISAVDCITNAVEKATKLETSIDKKNLGLIGHSFGGYKTAAISVLSDLFKASVSGAGAYDMISQFTFNYGYSRKTPEWYMTENAQLGMKSKFSEDPEKYYENTPILHAHKTNTAMLLFTGLQDYNVHWENTRKMFIALKREQKPVIALFYKNIGHGISSSSPIENTDITLRTLDWFNYHLKNEKKINWIKKGLDYNQYSLSPL
ncbi:prolyl oligopeptidase family serine peptidase [Myroides albus]|uniref:alpha/beta hydrolase family protein n=1 Tax=Myroides albus TaxID=2562892 RepID=UPI002159A706|nr:prolyl oligopeptidase family serine peptidase [Myroides albus]UVD79116.1 prolyl oligopeptidase family serine peptidase [Myroides albus]